MSHLKFHDEAGRVRHGDILFAASLIMSAALGAACTSQVEFGNQPTAVAAATITPPSSPTNPVLPPSNPPPVVVPTPPPCQLQSVTAPVKLLFVIDTSGSNNSATTDNGTQYCFLFNCSPPTDPNKSLRSGSINAFFNQYQAKANFSWGFETFSNDTVTPYIANSSGGAAFANASAMQSAINQFNRETDGGDTPYIAALSQAASAISADPSLNATQAANAALYYVVFMSDGYPTDALNSDGSVNESEVDSAVSQLVSLAPGRVFLSTVYYGTINDPNAASTLANMAQVGRGQYVNVDTATQPSLNISDLIVVPSGQCGN